MVRVAKKNNTDNLSKNFMSRKQMPHTQGFQEVRGKWPIQIKNGQHCKVAEIKLSVVGC